MYLNVYFSYCGPCKEMCCVGFPSRSLGTRYRMQSHSWNRSEDAYLLVFMLIIIIFLSNGWSIFKNYLIEVLSGGYICEAVPQYPPSKLNASEFLPFLNDAVLQKKTIHKLWQIVLYSILLKLFLFSSYFALLLTSQSQVGFNRLHVDSGKICVQLRHVCKQVWMS